LLFTINFAITSHSSQSLYLYFIKNLKYCSNSWFIYSVCLSIYRWNSVDNLVSILNILFNCFIKSTANCSPLLLIILCGNLCSFYISYLNSLAKSLTNISTIVAIRYVIFDNLLILHSFLTIITTYRWS